MLTQAELRKLLHYDPKTGVFTWRARAVTRPTVNNWNAKHAGKRAGGISAGGYRAMRIHGERYRVSRLAWLYVHGEWPTAWLDHKDRDTGNDRISNLRLATPSQNAMNRPAHCTNKLGIKGVHRYWNRYIAQINVNGKKTHLGIFLTAEAASAAYMKAAKRHFGEFSSV